MRPEQVLAVGADARERVDRFLGRRLVEAFLHELGVAEDGGERGPQLVAHVGDELRLVLAGDLELAALLRDLLEQASVLNGDHGLVGEGSYDLNLLRRERPGHWSCHSHDADAGSVSQQGNSEHCSEPPEPLALAPSVFRISKNVRHVNRCRSAPFARRAYRDPAIGLCLTYSWYSGENPLSASRR